MPTTAITFIGGPTALLEYAGLRFVTDPTFDTPTTYAEPGTTTLVKTAGPGVTRAGLGTVDVVLLSHHAHKDNLDWEGLELLAQGPLTLSTNSAASDLWGGTVRGFDDWESIDVDGVTVTVVPALHGPPGSESRTGEVVGFVLEAPGEPTVYVSGDNASLGLVEQIAERFPAIDIAVLSAGAARVPGIDAPLTLTAEQARAAADVLSATRVVVVHTEDWEHFSETRDDVVAAFTDSSALVPTPRGERVEL
ncbi:MBL fold metallo-hydrolase [Marisediminicola sp. LYQ134]|uniref:MBL fold metallo-hydrolase n=1 Tax=unclassified Marisediminicola TaxID=2618316 RepID=UPI00398383BC